MYCKRCGSQNPDGTSFCTNCGAPANAAVQPYSGYAPPKLTSEQKATKIDITDIAVSIAAAAILVLLIAMIGVFGFNTVKISIEGHTDRSSFSDYSDVSDDADLGFTKLCKVLFIFTEIGAGAGILLSCYMLFRKEASKGLSILGISGILMAMSYAALIIHGFYIKNKLDNPLFEVKGGPSIFAYFWFIVMIALAVAVRIISGKISNNNITNNIQSANSGINK